MKAWSLLLITGIVLPVMVFSEPIHVDLDFVRVNYDYNDYSNAYDHRYHYGNELMFLKKETDAVFTVPQDIGSEPFFGILPLSGQNGNLAFGVAKGKDSECYEELFIDIDADGHIGDNERFYTKSIELKEIHVHAGPIFRPVLSVFTFKVPLDDKENRQRTNVYELVIETRKEPNEEKYEINELRIYLVNGGYRHGYFFLNGIKYEVALFDLVLNGNFDDRFNYYRRGNRHSADGFIVAPVGNLDLRELAAPEYLSKFKVINNTIYEVSVVPDGSGLTLTPSDIPKGCLQIKPAAEKIDLYNRLGVFRIRGEELFILPTGKYRIRSIRYSKEDTDVKWRLWTKQCDKLNSIEIKPDEKAAFPFGAPFTSTVSCMSNGGAVFIWMYY